MRIVVLRSSGDFPFQYREIHQKRLGLRIPHRYVNSAEVDQLLLPCFFLSNPRLQILAVEIPTPCSQDDDDENGVAPEWSPGIELQLFST